MLPAGYTYPIKVKVPPNRPEGPEVLEVYLYSVLTSSLERGGWSAPRPGQFTSGKDPVLIVQEAGWAPGPVWTCAKYLTPAEIRSRTVQPVAGRYTDWAIPAPIRVRILYMVKKVME
jgi:hypothetical protein